MTIQPPAGNRKRHRTLVITLLRAREPQEPVSDHEGCGAPAPTGGRIEMNSNIVEDLILPVALNWKMRRFLLRQAKKHEVTRKFTLIP